MMISKKERRAQTAMRTIMGIGGMTAIALFMAATPASAQQCEEGLRDEALPCGTNSLAQGDLSTSVGN